MTKDQARCRLRDAVRYKRISKPETCSRCNRKTEARLLHGHHFKGYEFPLEVEWLCVHCHNEADKPAIVANGFKMRNNLIPGASHLVSG